MTNDELKILQNLPLDLKIAKSKLRIQEWYNYWGGKFMSALVVEKIVQY